MPFSPPGQPEPSPSATTTDGSRHAAVAATHDPAANQSWEAPAWLAQEHEQRADAEAALSSQAPAEDPVSAAPQGLAGSSLEDVALRMQRIKESAAAVRRAVEAPQQPPATVAHAAPVAAAPAPEPEPEPADLGGRSGSADPMFDDGMFGGGDDMFDGPGEEAPSPRAAAPVDDLDADDELDADDSFAGDGFRPTGFGDGFDDELDDEFDDDDDMGDFGDVSAARPLPWKPILAGAGVVLVAGLAIFWTRIFPPSPEDAATDEIVTEESADDDGKSIAKGAVAPAAADAKAEVPGAGIPVVPEGTPAAVGTPAPTGAAAVPAPTGATAPAEGDPAAAVPPAEGVAPTEAGAAPAAGAPAAGVPAAAGTPAAPVAPLAAGALEQLEEARGLYRKGGKKRLKQADELLTQILTAQPGHPDALVVSAQVKLELGQPEDALTTATKCTQVASEMADCWLTIGVLKQDSKDKTAAAEAYERYLALAPDGAYAGQVSKQLKRLR